MCVCGCGWGWMGIGGCGCGVIMSAVLLGVWWAVCVCVCHGRWLGTWAMVALLVALVCMLLSASAVMGIDIFRRRAVAGSITALKEDNWFVQQAKDASGQGYGSLVYAEIQCAGFNTLQGGCTFAIENTMVTHNPEVKGKLRRTWHPGDGRGVTVMKSIRWDG